MKILTISSKDMLKIADMSEIIQWTEDALRLSAHGYYDMPPRAQLEYGKNSLFLMPCFKTDGFGTKILTVFPDNLQYDKPVTSGLMFLNDGQTGDPIAILNGTELTALRTGAMGGVSIRYLSKPSVNRLGIIGGGEQGFYQVLAAMEAREISEIYVYDINPTVANNFAEKARKAFTDTQVILSKNSSDLLANSDIVITATTSRNPVLPEDQSLLANKHYVGIGSYRPYMQEWPKALYSLLKEIYIDAEQAIEETGDLVIPLSEGWLEISDINFLSDYIIDPSQKPRGNTTAFNSVGMALVDLYIAQLFYQKAIENGLDTYIEI